MAVSFIIALPFFVWYREAVVYKIYTDNIALVEGELGSSEKDQYATALYEGDVISNSAWLEMHSNLLATVTSVVVALLVVLFGNSSEQKREDERKNKEFRPFLIIECIRQRAAKPQYVFYLRNIGLGTAVCLESGGAFKGQPAMLESTHTRSGGRTGLLIGCHEFTEMENTEMEKERKWAVSQTGVLKISFEDLLGNRYEQEIKYLWKDATMEKNLDKIQPYSWNSCQPVKVRKKKKQAS